MRNGIKWQNIISSLGQKRVVIKFMEIQLSKFLQHTENIYLNNYKCSSPVTSQLN